MMKIEYSEPFLKDLKKLKKKTTNYFTIKELCFEELTQYESLSHINNLKKIRGYKTYYRIRVGDYRVGLKDEGDVIVLMRVMHRKDIYRAFPNPQSKK
ncbi:plasmid stabilization protein [Candidatus Magnetomorum sp. HK-1]|nr:plasmid stabilization protein [Candidatus Magnetomorum sp. HK-1]